MLSTAPLGALDKFAVLISDCWASPLAAALTPGSGALVTGTVALPEVVPEVFVEVELAACLYCTGW